jgi:hypothetical protein
MSSANRVTQREGWGLSSGTVEVEPLAKQTRKSVLLFRMALPEGFGVCRPGCQLLAYDMAQRLSARLCRRSRQTTFLDHLFRGKVMVRRQPTLGTDNASR